MTTSRNSGLEDVFYLVQVDIVFSVCVTEAPEGVSLVIVQTARCIFAVNSLLLAIKMAFTLQNFPHLGSDAMPTAGCANADIYVRLVPVLLTVPFSRLTAIADLVLWFSADNH
ncbi:hypothetical protein [Nostoc sp.]|uniref:hypothetical protein n=1 Tax=Nostoc sp. TaxID=1180 RepID=UPI002FFCF9EF